jgi:Arc/MetJ family transcription regulator
MRTTLDLPADLIDAATSALGFKSKTDTVVIALRELLRRQRLDQLKALMGRVELDVDVPKSRRRPRAPRRS